MIERLRAGAAAIAERAESARRQAASSPHPETWTLEADTLEEHARRLAAEADELERLIELVDGISGR